MAGQACGGTLEPSVFHTAVLERLASLQQLYTAFSLGQSWEAYQRMLQAGLPVHFFEILKRVKVLTAQQSAAELSCAEFFCGAAMVAAAFEVRGFPSLGLDIARDKHFHDITLSSGFLYALTVLLSVSPNGLLWLATVCSTWVFMSRSTTGRSSGDPLGCSRHATVDDGNIQAGRSALLALVAMCRGVFWALEQPHSSIMVCHPAWAHVHSLAAHFSWAPWYVVGSYMSAFGTQTNKPTDFFGNGAWLCCLSRPLVQTRNAQASVTTEFKADGKTTVTGKAKVLKSTQVYTREFGEAVFDSWVQGGNAVSGVWDLEEIPGVMPDPVVWDTASLDVVLRFLDAQQ